MRQAPGSSFSQTRMTSCRLEGWHWPFFQSVTPHSSERSSHICLWPWRLLHSAAALCASLCSPVLKPLLLGGFLFPSTMFGEDLNCPSPLRWPEIVAVRTSIVWALEEERLVSACNVSQVFVVFPLWFWRRSVGYSVKPNSLGRPLTIHKSVQLLVWNRQAMLGPKPWLRSSWATYATCHYLFCYFLDVIPLIQTFYLLFPPQLFLNGNRI